MRYIFLVFIFNIFAHEPSIDLTIRTTIGAGFFAELQKVVANLKYYENKHLSRVTVDWTEEFFPYKNDPIENGWDLFFEPILNNDVGGSSSIITDLGPTHEVHDQKCIDHWVSYNKYLSYRLNLNRIFNKYIKIKSNILNEAQEFYDQNLKGYYAIGVHVRFSAAHAGENPKGTPKLDDYINEINRIIKKKGTVKIFLASDSEYVINRFKKEYSSQMIVVRDAFRSKYDEEPHLIYSNPEYWLSHKAEFHAKKPGYFGGKTVLLDVITLSKCDILIHTTSNVSDFTTYLNPYIDSIYVPNNAITWPCRYNLK
jgi:hypothetical protein